MKTILMAHTCQTTTKDIFDLGKRGCPIEIKPEKETCGCKSHANNDAMSITSIIIDKATKQPLPGAHILNVETQKGAVSDDGGQFSVEASGDQMVTISFVGMKDLTLPASQIASTLEMEEEAGMLDEVIITAKDSFKSKTGLWIAAGLLGLFAYAKTRKPKRSAAPKPAVNG